MELLCPFVIIVGVVAAFASHRFWKGKMRLFDKNSSSTGSVIGLQEIVEPKVQHVIEAKELKRRSGENRPSPADGGSDDE